MLALAVARGLVEPGEAAGATLEQFLATGRLSAADHRLLEADLAELEETSRSHWSLDITAQQPAAPDDAPTALGPAAAPVQDEPSFSSAGQGGIFKARTLERWARFESLELLGEGGMGRIFRALDPRLNRLVALKLLRRGDPDLLQRFTQEAQLQARVDHPHVCRVYEVGEWRGQPYIAMQFIRGETLKQAAGTLSLEALLRLMVEVCEGVHAAHRVGLVHRDLKPANLMVERLEDGSTRACVLDFGLARGGEGKGLTETGRVMGTVSFMSPEQAKGHTALLDRRSDVFSLGATLYSLLTGTPPFEGDGMDCMAAIVKDDPLPLRRRVPTLPVDLETVVATCLQKDPRRRYATARALGEDLQLILDGEPIKARAATPLERALHWARKRKALVGATAMALVSMGIFGGFAVRERLRARSQTAYAQRFAQAAERIEALARYLKLQPARDLTQDQAGLRQRVAALAEEVAAAGPLAEAPGAYALGRARLALDDPAGARAQLERAWRLGFHAPEAAHALGRALASLYQVELGKAYALPDPDLRQRRLEALRTTLRDPAAEWLRRGATASLEPPAYREGLLTLLEGQPEAAIRLARAAQAQSPWFYEALQLEVEGWLAQARLAPGEPSAQVALAAAGRLLAEAELRAPCDVALLRLDMARWQEAVALGWTTGADPAPMVQGEVAVADRWLRLEPQSAEPLAWRARARGELARHLSQQEQDPGDWLAQAKADAEEALRRNPEEVEARTAQASVLRTEGLLLLDRGEDPTARLKEAVAAADRGLELDPGHIILRNIRSTALLFLIDTARLHGTYDRAMVAPYLKEAEAQALAHPGEAYYHGILGTLAQAAARAEAAKGGDATADSELAVGAYEAGLKTQSRHVGFHRGVILALAAQAKALAQQGKDPAEPVRRARAAYQRAREAGVPLESLAPFFLDALVAEAAFREARGKDSAGLLAEAGGLLPVFAAFQAERVELGAIRLRYYALMVRRGPRAQVPTLQAQGERLARSLTKLKPMNPEFWRALEQFRQAGVPPAGAKAAPAD